MNQSQLHSNTERYDAAFSPHWKRHTWTINGYVVWSGDDPSEVPASVIEQLEQLDPAPSLGVMIAMVSDAIYFEPA